MTWKTTRITHMCLHTYWHILYTQYYIQCYIFIKNSVIWLYCAAMQSSAKCRKKQIKWMFKTSEKKEEDYTLEPSKQYNFLSLFLLFNFHDDEKRNACVCILYICYICIPYLLLYYILYISGNCSDLHIFYM